MRDVVYILVTLAFFALCLGLVRACDAVIGPDDLDELDDLEPIDGAGSTPADDELTATVTR